MRSVAGESFSEGQPHAGRCGVVSSAGVFLKMPKHNVSKLFPRSLKRHAYADQRGAQHGSMAIAHPVIRPKDVAQAERFQPRRIAAAPTIQIVPSDIKRHHCFAVIRPSRTRTYRQYQSKFSHTAHPDASQQRGQA